MAERIASYSSFEIVDAAKEHIAAAKLTKCKCVPEITVCSPNSDIPVEPGSLFCGDFGLRATDVRISE